MTSYVTFQRDVRWIPAPPRFAGQAGMTTLLLLLILTLSALPVLAAEDGKTVAILAHNVVSPKIDRAIWGISFGDVDGDSVKEMVLLENNAVSVGAFEDKKFKKKVFYEWGSLLKGVRLFTGNLDDDPAEEIVVSAVEEGVPSSFALKWIDGNLKILFEREPWHLRVVNASLIGQRFNTSSFFDGGIYKLSVVDGKLKRGEKLDLPKRVGIFDFAVIDDKILVIKGFAPMLAFEKHGKRFKKTWSSGVRFGGSLNSVNATTREVLGITNEEEIVIDREPQIVSKDNGFLITAISHDIPLKNMIGRRAYIRSGKIVAYRSEPDFGFTKVFETEDIPGYISDFAVEGSKLTAVMQPDISSFYGSRESMLLSFELPCDS